MDKSIAPTCPRCGNKDLRGKKHESQLFCRNCGYQGHWRQFFEGEKEREEVQKLFRGGNLKGKAYIDWKKVIREENEKKSV